MVEYKIKGRKGIDDLQGIYAFVGNSQGDTSGTNDIEIYKASEGWMSFVFNCELTQEAINLESERRIILNSQYIKELIEDYKYGEEYEITATCEYNEVFDKPSPEDSHSASWEILDLGTNSNNIQ